MMAALCYAPATAPTRDRMAGGQQAMGKERLVIIGGDAAGMSAASEARRQNRDLQIIAFERGPYTSYAA
jgi:monoamine oxidase